MKKLSLRGFYRFIKSQPVSKRIKHNDTWCECAVGDYVRHTNRKADFATLTDFTKDKLPSYLFIALNEHGSVRRELSTYGRLAKFISKSGRI